MLEYVLYCRHYFHSLSFAKIQNYLIYTKKKGVFLEKRIHGTDMVQGSGFRVDIIHKKPFNVKAERLRNSRKGKSGKFANCNWRISRSSANSAVVTDELAGRHYLLPALDAV